MHVAHSAEAGLAQQLALYQALSRRATDVAIVSDANTNISYVSPSVVEIFGYTQEQILGSTGWDFVSPDDLPKVRDAVARVMDSAGASERVIIKIRDAADQWRWVEESITNCLSDPDIRGLVANLRDITVQVQAQEQLRASEARYRAIAETAQEGIAVVDPAGAIVFANQRLADILGLSLEATYRSHRTTLFSAATADEIEWRIARRAVGATETYDAAYRHPDGSEHLLSVSSQSLPLQDVGEIGTLVMVSDVTDSRRAENELRRTALYDSLTQLPNRALLTDRLTMALERQAWSDSGPVALIRLDLDQFKLINNSQGHSAGDSLLIEIGARLSQVVGRRDTVARLSADEFAVLCEETDEPTVRALAERLREAIGREFELQGHRVYIGAGIGIALSPPHDAEALMRFAGEAMNEAKTADTDRIRVFDSATTNSIDRKLLVMTSFPEALKTNALDLHYQPIVDIKTGELHGVEALLRWTDPQLGRVSPLEAIAASNALGLSTDLDRWVLNRACTDMALLKAQGVHPEAYLSVNMSAASLCATPLDELVAATGAATRWPSDQLVLEITESAIMSDAESAITSLSRLREQGVAIAVDDFGTGYSSLAYLKRLPVSILKIDRSFVEPITVDCDSRAITRSIIDLANALGLRTIAEGIETPEQAAVILELGCTNGQGYLWSPAVPLNELGNLPLTPRKLAIRR